MSFIHKQPSWSIAESLVTPESAHLDRRTFLKALGAAGGQ